MFTMDTVFLNNSPLKMLDALYRYYEKPENSMTIGEFYLILRLLVSRLEMEIEKTGVKIDDIMDENT